MVLLQTLSHAKACTASGLSANASNGLVKMCMETGGAYDIPRLGCLTVYTPVIMEAAYEVLADFDSCLLTSRKLQARPVAEYVLHQTSDEK